MSSGLPELGSYENPPGFKNSPGGQRIEHKFYEFLKKFNKEFMLGSLLLSITLTLETEIGPVESGNPQGEKTSTQKHESNF